MYAPRLVLLGLPLQVPDDMRDPLFDIATTRAARIGGQLGQSAWGRTALFVALTSAKFSPLLPSVRIATHYSGILDPLECLVEQGNGSVWSWSEALAPDVPMSPECQWVMACPSTEACLLRLVESEKSDEFEWYFRAADARRVKHQSSTDKAVERMRSLLGDDAARRLRQGLETATRSQLRERVRALLAHPLYPFDALASSIRQQDVGVARRVMIDADLIEFLSHMQGVSVVEIASVAQG